MAKQRMIIVFKKTIYLGVILAVAVVVSVLWLHYKSIAHIENENRAISEIISNALPENYRHEGFYEKKWSKMGSGRLIAVCSTPFPSPASTGVSPYVCLFLIATNKKSSPLVFSEELPQDNICVGLSLAKADPAYIIGVVSRPYAGSVCKNNLRVFEYSRGAGPLHELGKLAYTDGTCRMLKDKSTKRPTFLVVCPEKRDIKERNKTYLAIIYSISGKSRYSISYKCQTQQKHTDTSSAYQELRNELQTKLGKRLDLPKDISDLELEGVSLDSEATHTVAH